MSVDATPSFENEEMAEAIREQHAEKEQSEREQHVEAKSDKNSILESFESEIVHVRLKSWRIEMQTLDGSTEDWIEETAVRFSGIDEESEMDEAMQDEYIERRDRIVALLAENSVNDDYDADFWRQIPKQYRQECIGSLMEGGEEGRRAGN